MSANKVNQYFDTSELFQNKGQFYVFTYFKIIFVICWKVTQLWVWMTDVCTFDLLNKSSNWHCYTESPKSYFVTTKQNCSIFRGLHKGISIPKSYCRAAYCIFVDEIKQMLEPEEKHACNEKISRTYTKPC